MNTRILCIDDEPNVLAGLERNLRAHFLIETALSAELGLVALRERGPYAVILTDMRMPGMDGIQFLCKAREIAPDTVRTMLTGNNDQQTAVQAVNEGNVFRFVTKPCPSDLLIQTLSASVRQYQLITAERELLEQTLNGSVKLLTEILSMVDPGAFGKAQILREYARIYLNASQSPANSPWEIELAAMLLRLGCVTIPATVLTKMRSGLELTGAEANMAERMPEMGSNLLNNIPRLQHVAQIVYYQNKNYNGSGFPSDHVKGGEIPFGSRLLKVLTDLLEFESSGISRIQAFEKMRKNHHFYDPEILRISSENSSLPPLKLERSDAQTISLGELSIKDVLISPLTTVEGMLLVPEGTEISKFILQKIYNYQSLRVLKESLQVQVKRASLRQN